MPLKHKAIQIMVVWMTGVASVGISACGAKVAGSVIDVDGTSPEAQAAWTVELLAGTPGGQGARDGIADEARLASISSIVVDGDDAYIADWRNAAIRRVHLMSAEVTTFAGKLGWSDPDRRNGIGADATFAQPWALALLGRNLFVSDHARSGATLRRVSLDDAAVTTVIDPATNSPWRMTDPWNIVSLTASDAVLFLSTGNAIWSYTPSSGEFELLVGDPNYLGGVPVDGIGAAAKFGYILSLANDNSDTLIVGDLCVLRRVDLVSRSVTTISNLQACGYQDGVGAAARLLGTMGLAWDPDGLYIADYYYNHIFTIGEAGGKSPAFSPDFGLVRRLDLGTIEVSTLAGSLPPASSHFGELDGIGTATRILEPAGIASTPDAIYVGTRSTIRRVGKSTGLVTTVAGARNDGPLLDPGPLLVDGASLYGFLQQRAELVRIDTISGALDVIQSYDSERFPVGYCDGLARIDSTLYCLTSSGIVARDLDSGATRIAVSFDASLDFVPRDLISNDRRLLLVCQVGGEVQLWEIDPSSAEPEPRIRFRTGELHWGSRLASASGAAYVTDRTTLARIDTSTWELSTIAGGASDPGCTDGNGADTRFTRLVGLAADRLHQRLFVGDVGCHTVRQVDLATGKVATIAGSPENAVFAPGVGDKAGLNYPAFLAYDELEDVLYVADPRDNIVMKLTAAEGG